MELQHWRRKTVAPMVLGLIDEYDDNQPFYVRPGQALFWGGSLVAVTCSVESLDALGQVFQVTTWKHRW